MLVEGRDIMEAGWSGGVTIVSDEALIRLDPFTREDRSSLNLISHAHGDHTAGFRFKAEKCSTAETKEIFTSRRGRGVEGFRSIEYGGKVSVGDIEIVAHDAGHMLGSTLFEVRCGETTLLYTGDINCVDTLTTQAAEAVPCDILVIESTYGNPSYIFPPREETYARIVRWAIGQVRQGKTPTLHAYVAGKAQELIRLFNDYTLLPVVVHPAVARVNEAYEKNGVRMAYTSSESEDGRKLLKSHRCVHIVPSYWSPDGHDGCSKAVATGWAVRFKPSGMDTAFPLSSHADFRQLVEYVRRVRPRRVCTVNGFRDALADYVSRRVGVAAHPLRPIRQKQIREFL
ncbi:MAG: MBL fold metallo-hydrolase RNA specificity domain-containing protein [Candidatus Bathyarchaeia archaeon]